MAPPPTFTGSFDGLGHVITGLTMNRTDGYFAGLFGYASGATIRNVGLDGGSVSARVAQNTIFVGALAGYAVETSISNVWTTSPVTVTGWNPNPGSGYVNNIYAGGLVGYSYGTSIGNASASGAVTATGGGTQNFIYAGGLVGYAQAYDYGVKASASISNAWAKGAVTASSSTPSLSSSSYSEVSAGGLIGYAQSNAYYGYYSSTGSGLNIDNVWATGTVNASAAGSSDPVYAGGLIGMAGASSYNDMFMMGSGSDYSSDASLNIRNAWTTGAVTASGSSDAVYAGGLVGYAGSYADDYADYYMSSPSSTASASASSTISIEDAWATGAITASGSGNPGYAGGLVGYAQSTANDYNYGSNSVDSYLSSANSTVSIANAWAAGAVTASGANDPGYTGGLVGYAQSTSRDDSSTNSNSSASATVDVTDAYWDMVTSGQTTSVNGGTGLTTTQMMQAASFANWNIDSTGGQDTTWRIYEGKTYPWLKSFMTPLALKIDGGNAVYDGSYHSAGGNFTVPDGVDASLVMGTLDTTVGPDAGTYTLDVGGLYSTQLGYDLLPDSTATFTITPAALAVTYTADTASSIYGDAIAPLSGSVTATGLQGSDTLAGVTSGTAQWSTSADTTSGVGSYGITGDGLSGNSGNYTFTFNQADTNDTALTITARPITVTADDQSRTMGQPNPALTWTVGDMGLVNGDSLSGEPATLADRNSGPGTYAITQGSLAASANYQLGFVDGELSVTAVSDSHIGYIVPAQLLQEGQEPANTNAGTGENGGINAMNFSVNLSGGGDDRTGDSGHPAYGQSCENGGKVGGSTCVVDSK